MKLFSIKSLASRGWLTVFCSLTLCVISVALIASSVQFGKDLIGVALVVLPFGLYDIVMGRRKFNDISLNEYKLSVEKKGIGKIQIVLVVVGSVLSGLAARYLG